MEVLDVFLASVHSIWKSPWTLWEKKNATQLERRRKCGTFYVTRLNNVMIECKRTTETTIDPGIQSSHPKTGDRWEGSASRVHDQASLIPVIPSILPIQLFSLRCCQSSCCAALISFPSAQRLSFSQVAGSQKGSREPWLLTSGTDCLKPRYGEL